MKGKSQVELTIRAVLLGAVLSVLLTAANAYFGLFAGMTVSASIPAAVISMAILRFFKNSSVLENNLVQTAASAGEVVASGVIFTIPALVLMGYWDTFNYWQTTAIAMCGGILGVLFTVPLRKALIVKEKLNFPEGRATAEVLKAGESDKKSIRFLVIGGFSGAIFKIGEALLKLWDPVYEKAAFFGNKLYLYGGMSLSPALLGVGYIVGLNISFLLVIGGFISWYFGIPIYIYFNEVPDVAIESLGITIWSQKIRFLGVGAMVVGGIWTLLSIRSSVVFAFRSGIDAFRNRKNQVQETVRTEMDTPMSWVMIGVGVMIVPIYFIYHHIINDVPITLLMTVVMVFCGFLFATVGGYMAGLVGSSNTPISGVTISTILFTSILLLLLIGAEGNDLLGPAAAIFVGGVVACSASIASDNMQDLKAGHILGATPYKQQMMQIVGVISGALVIAPVLNWLLKAYGFGIPTDELPNALQAPQASLMHSIAQGVFQGGLPWNIISIGAIVGVVIIIADEYLKRTGSAFRMPVLAVAIGIYLPLELDVTVFLGGILSYLVERQYKGEFLAKAKQRGLLIASGLVTGEALMGIVIAILILLKVDVSVKNDWLLSDYTGITLFMLLCFGFYRLIVLKLRD